MIYLCSSSPTRALLLDKFKVDYTQVSVDFDEEQIDTTVATEFVYTASKGKMDAAIKKFGLEIPLLCADTVIATSSQEILRKAKDEDDAKEILLKQSGSSISIISSMHYSCKDLFLSDISATHYHFDTFDMDDLDAYIQSGLWQGKAGACMVEGFCKRYIKKVVGLESTAMGLQVEVLLPWLN